MDTQEKLKKALIKKALGYNADEVVCEYVLDDEGEQKLSKKKVTRKHYAPDISAVKMLFERFYGHELDISGMTDEGLEQEKLRLLKMLKEEESDGDN